MADEWRLLKMPYICERMVGFSIPQGVGFSIPQGNEILVVSYEGAHSIWLGKRVSVETDTTCDGEAMAYQGQCYWRKRTWSILGLHGGSPILNGIDGESLVLDSENETISVVKDNRELWTSEFENSSGDWCAATFSPDGRFIVLGCPYGFDFRVWERVPGGSE
jgi:hypothetical protein